MTEQITVKGKVNKGIRDYWNIMTKDNLEALRGKNVTMIITEVKE